MDILKSALVTIFKEQNPYKILKNHYYLMDMHKKENNYSIINKKTFIDLHQQLEKEYSKDEIENLYDVVNEKMKNDSGKYIHKNIFNLLINYSEEMLEYCGNNVKCKYKQLLKWRMSTLKLDQDLFICAYLAYRDLLMGKDRSYFDWDTIIKSNNIRIHNMLSKGISENHFHLKGSAPTFKLSWISLMNDLSCRNTLKIPIDNEENRLDKDLVTNMNLKDAIVVAALIRLILFKVLELDDSKENKKDIAHFENLLKQFISDNEKEIKTQVSMNSREIQKEIDAIRFIFGTNVEYLNKNIKVDYALTKDINIEDRATRLFIGERSFMYKCFRRICLEDKYFLSKANLFYAYIIIKNKLRAELIQTNDRVGFCNFSEYQDRKTKYLKDRTILRDFVEPGAILTSIKNQNMISIEARIMPEMTAAKNVHEINKMDKIICNQIYSDKNNKWINSKNDMYSENEINEELSISKAKLYLSMEEKKKISDLKNKFFYVFHFPKNKDSLEGCRDDIKLKFKCRHYYTRQELKKYAEAIYEMREKNQKVASRVLGIDACSNELYVRPEIYGQAFRFLKGHLPRNDYQRDYKKGESLGRLRATYHVGEDFLDCADGLRAIDEAILFLGLTHGDRLGHAIALGIDVNDWYKKKNNKVYLSMHAVLDNVAWLIYKLKEFDINNSSEYIEKLTRIYNEYYTKLYINNSDSLYKLTGKTVITVDTYMESWKLRGDDPKLYRDLKIEHEAYCYKDIRNNIYSIKYWDRCSSRDKNNHINESASELYHRYHYDAVVKKQGYEIEAFKVDAYMITCIKEVQRCMQDYVRKSGIGIECNPSSNVLISNFNRYDKHPILNFYNLGLTNDTNKINENPQLFVSINTDDQGVFDTLIENEFALMAIALEKAKDEEGKPIYNQAMIYDWLDRIRKMGIEQSFKIVSSPNELY
ncbi:hypothetical protein [Clostridium beijerinckii]|uniref:hypothetical protein n=1 Tax=Clostridium beijerinckii TaxID=1520 RepID=UPI0013613D7E|nr:hypothetical protein [Clostridium beijerinckii]MZK50964.1 hypothetical protein [Clostridium beijerinckii]MZK59166.1 hypothetical protein [Clostridium beijerinckii]MZK69285.1 hypothetical protein [Clostridium beijerinckii]MZK74658.1 hypothetical protein [Clostridium beijerinckii]MZK84377.1 hypothetical protein [Clostridium beijerinckii]